MGSVLWHEHSRAMWGWALQQRTARRPEGSVYPGRRPPLASTASSKESIRRLPRQERLAHPSSNTEKPRGHCGSAPRAGSPTSGSLRIPTTDRGLTVWQTRVTCREQGCAVESAIVPMATSTPTFGQASSSRRVASLPLRSLRGPSSGRSAPNDGDSAKRTIWDAPIRVGMSYVVPRTKRNR